MFKNKKEIVIIICMFLSLTFLAFGYKYIKGNSNTQSKNEVKVIEQENSEKESNEKPKNEKIFVHIDGEVNKPDMYEMKNGDRVKDLIDKAGGLTDTADKSKINFAIKLKDEMKIYIYKVGENQNSENNIISENSSNVDNKLININTASEEELCKLTGIGTIKAKLIIEYRQKTKFSKIEDIIKVSGIGKKTFEKIKDKITVD